MIYDYQPRHLIEEEAEHVISLIKKEDPLVGLLCSILYRTGRRISEVLYLTRRNMKYQIRTDEFIIYFPIAKIRKTKIRNSSQRKILEVTLPAKAIREWEEILSIYGSPPRRVYFFSRHPFKREIDITLRKRYERVLKKLHYKDEVVRDLYTRKGLLFHVWRHSYAWRLKNKRNIQLDELCDLMAHSDIKITKDNYDSWFIDSRKRDVFWGEESYSK